MRISDSRQTHGRGRGRGRGGVGRLGIWGCRLQLPHSPRGWSFTPLRSPPCIQDPPSPLSPEATQGNSPLRIVTRFSGLTGDFGNQVKDKSETELPEGGMPMYLSAKWVSGRSIAAALQSCLTMDRPPSGTPSPVIREPSRGRRRCNKVSVGNSTEPCSEKVLSYTDRGCDPWQKDAPLAGKANSLGPLALIWNKSNPVNPKALIAHGVNIYI